jgi:hypothetical protein
MKIISQDFSPRKADKRAEKNRKQWRKCFMSFLLLETFFPHFNCFPSTASPPLSPLIVAASERALFISRHANE